MAVINFTPEILEISNNGSNKQYNIRLEDIISKLGEKKAKIVTNNANDFKLGFKSSMIDNFKKSEKWKILQDKFPKAQILDIVHKDSI